MLVNVLMDILMMEMINALNVCLLVQLVQIGYHATLVEFLLLKEMLKINVFVLMVIMMMEVMINVLLV